MTEDQGYFVSRCDMWPDERLITSRIFEDSKSGAEIDVSMLDFSKIHNPNHDISQDFVDKLSYVQDLEIFKYKSIQAIINFRWKLAKRYVMIFQLIPYCVFFTLYIIYAIVIFDLDS